MRRLIITGILALITGVTSMMAQGQLQVKSKAEAEAVQALGNAQSAGDSDAIIKAAEDLLTKFADTQFKEMALALEADAWRRKGDAIKAQVYGERVLEVNPKSIQANLMLAEVIVQGTGDRDLDKEEKLAKAEKYLNTTLDVLKTAPKPNPQVTDQEWAESKQFITAQARNDFGMIALSRKKYDDAIAAFQQAIASDPQQAAYQARLASAYQQGGKYAEAIAQCDKMLADPQLHPQIKTFVTNVKAAATKAQAAKK